MTFRQSPHPAATLNAAGRKKNTAKGISFCIFFRGIDHLLTRNRMTISPMAMIIHRGEKIRAREAPGKTIIKTIQRTIAMSQTHHVDDACASIKRRLLFA